MIMGKLRLIIISISMLGGFAYGQGCSDAGFCTINSFQPVGDEEFGTLTNQIKAAAFFGSADHSIAVYGNYLAYSRQLNDKIGIDAKLTTLAQNGHGISTFGLSDIFLNANYSASEQIKVTLGVKVPFSNASKTLDDLPLPMDYQASLGTFDLVFGLGYAINEIQFVVAVQQPLTQNNNAFLASAYPENSKLRAFQSTNNFKRSADVLLRISYPISLSQKLKLTPSVLPIYHLENDKYTDELNVEKEIVGSQGLTLNGNVYVDYQINKQHIVLLNVGMPFIVRDARPDGLTRSFMANVEYKFNF